jgi:hypothetical protein
MRTATQKPKPAQQTTSAGSMAHNRISPAPNHTADVESIIDKQIVQRSSQTQADQVENTSGGNTAEYFAHDFSRIPLHPRVPTATMPMINQDVAGRFSQGAPLDAEIRQRYESKLGASLADVRIHTGAQASASADALDADAYTVGRDIVFGAGRYAPKSSEGKRLLAHELAHVVQQRTNTGAGASLAVSHPGNSAEREADRAADSLVAGYQPHLAIGSEPLAIYRQPRQQPRQARRADRFLPAEKKELKRLGGGELDELIDKIIADNAYHKIRQQTIDGVEHTWEVKTAIVELTEQEESQGAQFGGALKPDEAIPSDDGKKLLHRFTYILRGGRASSIESALHELIHLRIAIDRSLPEDERSSFFSGYNQLNEMTEVMASAKFGAKGTITEKASYGALPLVTGHWEQVRSVLKKIEAIRIFYIQQDKDAEAKFNSEKELTPMALIEFLAQEKFVTQTAAKAVSGNAPSNETVATRYARTIINKFAGRISEDAQTRINSSTVGNRQRTELTDELRLSIQRLYEALDKSLREAKEFEKNPPERPDNMPNPQVFELRPVGMDGEPIPFK